MYGYLYFFPSLYILLQTSRDFHYIYWDEIIKTGFAATSVYAMAFDSIWVLAVALNHTEIMRMTKTTQEVINKTDCVDLEGDLVPLNEFNYSNEFMGCVINYNFQNVDFIGVSVSYNQLQVN